MAKRRGPASAQAVAGRRIPPPMAGQGGLVYTERSRSMRKLVPDLYKNSSLRRIFMDKSQSRLKRRGRIVV